MSPFFSLLSLPKHTLNSWDEGLVAWGHIFGTENTSSLGAGPDTVSGMKAMLWEKREGMTAPLLEFLQGWKSHWTHIPSCLVHTPTGLSTFPGQTGFILHSSFSWAAMLPLSMKGCQPRVFPLSPVTSSNPSLLRSTFSADYFWNVPAPSSPAWEGAPM